MRPALNRDNPIQSSRGTVWQSVVHERHSNHLRWRDTHVTRIIATEHAASQPRISCGDWLIRSAQLLLTWNSLSAHKRSFSTAYKVNMKENN